MLIIGASQLQTLQAEQLRRFEHDAVAHVRTQLPRHFDVLGEQGTLDAVRQGIAGAKVHGLETQLGVTVFIRLCFVFGLDFADRFAWAQDALAERSADERLRVKRLSAAAASHARELATEPES